MYKMIKEIIVQDGSHDPIDPWVVEEIAGWYKQSGVDDQGLSNMIDLSPEVTKAEINGVYSYLVSGRAFFGGQR